MRSRVVPMREMREKFGAEVKDFPYAFIIKHHHPGWDSPPAELAIPADVPPAMAATAAMTANPPKYIDVNYIEVHRRPS